MIFRLDQTLTSARRKGSKKKRSNAKLVPATAEFRVEPCLMDLARLRVAQILGCKRCMREYAAMLKKGGEINQRLRLLESWRNELAFTPQEKAALNLAEAVTCNPLDPYRAKPSIPLVYFLLRNSCSFLRWKLWQLTTGIISEAFSMKI